MNGCFYAGAGNRKSHFQAPPSVRGLSGGPRTLHVHVFTPSTEPVYRAGARGDHQSCSCPCPRSRPRLQKQISWGRSLPGSSPLCRFALHRSISALLRPPTILPNLLRWLPSQSSPQASKWVDHVCVCVCAVVHTVHR